MKRVFAVIVILSTLTLTGCANGPIRNFFRGAACRWCARPVNTCDTCTTSQTSFAPSYEIPAPNGAEVLPSPQQIGPAK